MKKQVQLDPYLDLGDILKRLNTLLVDHNLKFDCEFDVDSAFVILEEIEVNDVDHI